MVCRFGWLAAIQKRPGMELEDLDQHSGMRVMGGPGSDFDCH
jgi:hypothetical protein